jgi:hypothetical protein
MGLNELAVISALLMDASKNRSLEKNSRRRDVERGQSILHGIPGFPAVSHRH